MLPIYEDVLDRQPECRKAFGEMLLNWRLSNGWTQYTACKWAKEAGFETISYGNLSVLEQGKAGELRQKAFFQLEELNRRLDHDKHLLAIKDIGLRSLVENAKPLCAFGVTWNAVDFWSCYTGYTEVPVQYRTSPAPVVSLKKAKELSDKWRNRLRISLKQCNGVPAELFSVLVNQAPDTEKARFSAMLLFDSYTPAELQLLWREGRFLPDAWFDQWDALTRG
jgi:transcriptional regulator with XRE-family HTH domain